MSNLSGSLIGAVAGIALRTWQYVGQVPDGASLDSAGLIGFALSGAFIGAILGVVAAAIVRALRRKG